MKLRICKSNKLNTDMTTIVSAAIDYSMTSPAVTLYAGEVSAFDFGGCECYYLTDKKKFVGKFGSNISGDFLDPWESDEERFNRISDWVVSKLSNYSGYLFVGIEGYSYGSKGKCFNIAENTGLLKHKMWSAGIKMEIVSPSSIKKSGSGKGNATKQILEECFVAQTAVNIRDLIGQTDKQFNPSSDIIDSFFLLQYLIKKYAQDALAFPCA